jgi:hypothetical protein
MIFRQGPVRCRPGSIVAPAAADRGLDLGEDCPTAERSRTCEGHDEESSPGRLTQPPNPALERLTRPRCIIAARNAATRRETMRKVKVNVLSALRA